MDTSARARGYDIFKLIVAVLLLLLFLLLLWRGNSQIPPPPTATLPPSAATPSYTPMIAATITPPEITSTTVPVFSLTATQTSMLVITSTDVSPTETVTDTASPTSTAVITFTATPQIEITNTPTAEAPSNASACDLAFSRSHLQVGTNAVILHRLNFRSSPGIANNWLYTNKPNTQVEIIGGPTCLPHFVGAYMWWQIKLPDGRIGWSAEASLRGAFYFMEPTP